MTQFLDKKKRSAISENKCKASIRWSEELHVLQSLLALQKKCRADNFSIATCCIYLYREYIIYKICLCLITCISFIKFVFQYVLGYVNLYIVAAQLRCFHHTQQREYEDRKQCRGRQREGFCYPVHSHKQQSISTFPLLKIGRSISIKVRTLHFFNFFLEHLYTIQRTCFEKKLNLHKYLHQSTVIELCRSMVPLPGYLFTSPS